MKPEIVTDPLHRAALALARWHLHLDHWEERETEFWAHARKEHLETADHIAVVLHDDACAHGSLDVTKPCEGWRVEELDHDGAYWEVQMRLFDGGWGRRSSGFRLWKSADRHDGQGWARQLAEEGF